MQVDQAITILALDKIVLETLVTVVQQVDKQDQKVAILAEMVEMLERQFTRTMVTTTL